MTTSLSERVAKLLNQAENAGTEAEAATFMEKAQQIAEANSIDLAKARFITQSKEKTVPEVRRITLGVAKARGLNTLVSLFSGIAAANSVRINIAHNSTFVNAFGFTEDIDMCEALFASLSVQMAHAAAEFKKTGQWKEDKVYKSGYWEYYNTETGASVTKREYDRSPWHAPISERLVPGGYVPVPWLSARLDFQNAFASRIGLRLGEATAKARRAAEAEEVLQSPAEAEGTVGTALVLADKAKAVSELYAQKSTARGSYRGYRTGTVSSSSRDAGYAAGSSARLSSASALPGARKAIA